MTSDHHTEDARSELDPSEILGRRLVALRQTPWFAPCHRQVGLTNFTCRTMLLLEGDDLFELDEEGLFRLDGCSLPLEGVELAEHRAESLRSIEGASPVAVLLPSGEGLMGQRRQSGPPLIVLDQGSFLTLGTPPGTRFWLGDLEDLVHPQVGDGGGRSGLGWCDLWTGRQVDLRIFLPMAAGSTVSSALVSP